MVAKNPFLILANAKVAPRNLSELVAYDKANPGKLTFATDGPRNFSGILATWLNNVSGANILQVPYATMPQGVQDTLAGRTQLTILSPPSAAPHIASGALKPLAISWTKRLPQFRAGAVDFRNLSGGRTHRLVRDRGAGRHACRGRCTAEPGDGQGSQDCRNW